MCSAMPSSIKSSPAPEEIYLASCLDAASFEPNARSGLAFTWHRPAGATETAKRASRVTAFETAVFFPAVQTGRGESQRTQWHHGPLDCDEFIKGIFHRLATGLYWLQNWQLNTLNVFFLPSVSPGLSENLRDGTFYIVWREIGLSATTAEDYGWLAQHLSTLIKKREEWRKLIHKKILKW